MLIKLIRTDTPTYALESPKPLIRVTQAQVLDFIETCREDEIVEITIRPR